MCEPYHSIVQLPVEPPQGSDDFVQISYEDTCSKLGQWCKRIKKWFHLSKFGKGHYQATTMAGISYLGLFDSLVWKLYEGEWWYREFRLDGALAKSGQSASLEAYNAAKEYHIRCCTQNISVFRRFLEKSLMETDRMGVYFDVLRIKNGVFNARGVNELNKILKHKPAERLIRLPNTPEGIRAEKKRVRARKSIVGRILGLTRKRELFSDTFSDDAFWRMIEYH